MGTNDDVGKNKKSDEERAARSARIEKILQDLDYSESKESVREAYFSQKEREAQYSNRSDSRSTYRRRTTHARQSDQIRSAKQTSPQQIKSRQSKKAKQPKKPNKV